MQIACGILKPLPGKEDGFEYYKVYRLHFSDRSIMEYSDIDGFIKYCVEGFKDAMVECVSTDDDSFNVLIDRPFYPDERW